MRAWSLSVCVALNVSCAPGGEEETADFPADIPGATGADYFAAEFGPSQGLGPLYNGVSCVHCHAAPSVGGMPPEDGLEEVLRIGFLDGEFDDLAGRGGPVARSQSVSELGADCILRPGIPSGVNVVSVRNSPPLYGLGDIEALTDSDIDDGTMPSEGFANWGRDAEGVDRIGRFGWKADTTNLKTFVAEAFRNELGLTNPLFPEDLIPADTEGFAACAGNLGGIEASEEMVDRVTEFIASLPGPQPAVDVESLPGLVVFETIGCADCHIATLGEGDRAITLYSDLLLHDMGASLDDAFVQGNAEGPHWRTTPLWGLGSRQRLLHDGRTESVEVAILAHGGEAMDVVASFADLVEADRTSLLDFLGQL